MPVKPAVSLKAMAEGQYEGVQKTTQFKIDPRLIQVEEGFNPRPIDLDHVIGIKTSIRTGAIMPPVLVRVEDGKVIMVDGHHRRKACVELIEEGLEIVAIDAMQFRGSDAERTATAITSAQTLPLTPMQMGRQYLRLVGFGWDAKRIAARVGRTPGHVADMVRLAQSNSDVQELVDTRKVSADNAVRLVRKHGSKAGEVIKNHLEEAEASGKKKVTEGTIKAAEPAPKFSVPEGYILMPIRAPEGFLKEIGDTVATGQRTGIPVVGLLGAEEVYGLIVHRFAPGKIEVQRVLTVPTEGN